MYIKPISENSTVITLGSNLSDVPMIQSLDYKMGDDFRYNNSINYIKNNWRTARYIEKELSYKYGIDANFKNNDVVANCIRATVDIFTKIFPPEYLPDRIRFESFIENYPEQKRAAGLYYDRCIAINSDYPCFYDIDTLWAIEKRQAYGDFGNFFFQSGSSARHILATFVHEFAHCAHHANVVHNGNSWDYIHTLKVPPYIHNTIISRNPIGKYAYSKPAEFVAEALTRQILHYPSTISADDKYCMFSIPEIEQDGRNYLRALWSGNKCEITRATNKMNNATEEACVQKDTADAITALGAALLVGGGLPGLLFGATCFIAKKLICKEPIKL